MKIGMLISGRGSNTVASIDAEKSDEILQAKTAVVISDEAFAAGGGLPGVKLGPRDNRQVPGTSCCDFLP